ncbi:MAG: lytic transglycosylase domain-containing protein [Candidatus Thiothrix moscowensis]|nr:lytic transglycosylase domain-containing protein [Candidatus Thiothrix moscowensis]
MRIKKLIQRFGVLAALLSMSANAFAGSCDQQHVNVLRQKASVYNDVITDAAIKYRINPALITAIITAESCFQNEARSHKGAGGLMQLIPATAKRFGVSDRFDPAENIEGGTRYLRWLLNRYGGSIPHAVAAYNAGEGRVDEYGVHVPFEETATYSRRVLNAYSKLASSGRTRTAKPQAVAKTQPQVRVIHASYRNQAPSATKTPEHWPWDNY